jgi:hypothetical protein
MKNSTIIPVPRYMREYAAAIRRLKQAEYDEIRNLEILLDMDTLTQILYEVEKGHIKYSEAMKMLVEIDTKEY